MKGYNAKSKFGREGMGEDSSFIKRLNNLGHTFLDEDTTEHYISEALLLHVERFFCEQVRILNKWGGGEILHVHVRPTLHVPTCFLLC